MDNFFMELLQVSLGGRQELSVQPTEEQWIEAYEEAERQAVVGILIAGVEKIQNDQRPSQELLLQWIGTTEMIKQQNKLLNKRCVELYNVFSKYGFKCCILKGQGNAILYPNSLLRQSGDIDIWVDCTRDKVMGFLRNYGQVCHVDIKHCDWRVFEDTEVEVHFIPTWFYNPLVNRRLQRWFEGQRNAQFENKSELGFCVPTADFNLVYVLIHIYRHLFDEGVGLRQLMDYYYVLIHSTAEERQEAMSVLCSFKMRHFVGVVMFVMQEVFKLDDEYLMCKPLRKDGLFLLDEIMRAGNFGQYDERNNHHQGRLANGMENVKRNLRFIGRYPQEVCWMPAWKVGHWCWRKWKGYL